MKYWRWMVIAQRRLFMHWISAMKQEGQMFVFGWGVRVCVLGFLWIRVSRCVCVFGWVLVLVFNWVCDSVMVTVWVRVYVWCWNGSGCGCASEFWCASEDGCDCGFGGLNNSMLCPGNISKWVPSYDSAQCNVIAMSHGESNINTMSWYPSQIILRLNQPILPLS